MEINKQERVKTMSKLNIEGRDDLVDAAVNQQDVNQPQENQGFFEVVGKKSDLKDNPEEVNKLDEDIKPPSVEEERNQKISEEEMLEDKVEDQDEQVKADQDKEDIPWEILEFESKVVEGLGEHGVKVSGKFSDAEGVAIISKYSFNKNLSDMISLTRETPELRHPDCQSIEYDSDLPKASVIIIFNNEEMSTLLRTVWSSFKYANGHVQEVILIDDGSTLGEIKTLLPLYIKYRLSEYNVILERDEEQRGLIAARMRGARLAKGS